LYDHKLSGNGTGACASCHIDAEMDLLAWNLGNPDGVMTFLQQGNTDFAFHPMKGPMTTQSLRGLANLEPYHWRGDKPDFAAFNGAFAQLLGGSQLSDADMAAFTNFVNTIVYQPNPYQNLDRTLPSSVPLPDVPGVSANPNTGENIFLTTPFNNDGKTCVGCHTYPGPGTNLRVTPSTNVVEFEQPVKIPHLRNMYQKTNLNFNTGGVSINGYGFNHDGQIGGMIEQITNGSFPFFKNNPTVEQPLEAFELCFDTGTAPAVGYSRTLNSANVTSSPAQSDWSTLQGQANAGNIDLIANGTIQGQVHGLLYLTATNNYETDTTGLGPFTQAQIAAFIQAGDTLTIMGVPPGSGVRMALDTNLDNVLNGDARRLRAASKQK
jgi:hypothetical protein